MEENKTLWSRLSNGADKSESATRPTEGPILVNPYGMAEFEGAFYYQDYQSYLDDEPYIRRLLKKQAYKPDTYGQHYWVEYDDQNPEHLITREHSFLVLLQFSPMGILLNGIATTFKEAMVGNHLPNRLILPLKVLELSTDIFNRPTKRSILKDVYKNIKKRRLYVEY